MRSLMQNNWRAQGTGVKLQVLNSKTWYMDTSLDIHMIARQLRNKQLREEPNGAKNFVIDTISLLKISITTKLPSSAHLSIRSTA